MPGRPTPFAELASAARQPFPDWAYELLRRLAASFRRPALFDDLVQEGYFGWLDAVRTWRPEGGASLRTLAGRRAYGRMQDLVHGDRRRPTSPRLVPLERVLGTPLEPGRLDPDRVGARDELYHVMRELPARARQVLWLRHAERLDVVEVAQRLGVSRTTAITDYRAAIRAVSA